jgi:hypothetical protein
MSTAARAAHALVDGVRRFVGQHGDGAHHGHAGHVVQARDFEAGRLEQADRGVPGGPLHWSARASAMRVALAGSSTRSNSTVSRTPSSAARWVALRPSVRKIGGARMEGRRLAQLGAVEQARMADRHAGRLQALGQHGVERIEDRRLHV